MKYLMIGMLLTAGVLTAQDSASMEVQRTVEQFFEGFHQKDSTKIKATTVKNIMLQTISRSSEGDTIIRSDDFGEFLKSICSIPDSLSFREEIREYQIRIDGPLAHAWTPYKFWLNDKLSHCGVNSFQLVKQRGAWKITYLIDTRRKDNCP